MLETSLREGHDLSMYYDQPHKGVIKRSPTGYTGRELFRACAYSYPEADYINVRGKGDNIVV